MKFAQQLQMELYKMFARRRTYIGFAAFVALQGMLAVMFNLPLTQKLIEKMLERNGLSFDVYFGGLSLALFTIVMSFGILGGLYIALVGGDIVAKDVEDGTMRLLLARPVSRVRLLTVKWVACLIYSIALIVFLGVSSLVTGVLMRGHLGSMFFLNMESREFMFLPPEAGLLRYGAAIGMLAYISLVIASASFMFSCFRVKPAAATILTVTVFFVDMVIYNIPFFAPYREFTLTHHTGFYMRTFSAYPPWPHIWQSVVYIGAWSVTCYAIGVARFNSRDLKA